ncbi:MAG: hypothetical protein ACX94A_05640 [Algiphilus sp.]
MLRSAIVAMWLGLVVPVNAGDSGALERALDAALSLPAASIETLDIYIGTDIDDLSVQSAQVTMGNVLLTRLEVGGRAATALHHGGMLRLRIPCPGATHDCGRQAAGAKPGPGDPLVVEVLARRTDAAMSATLVRLTYALAVDLEAEAAPPQLMLTRDGVWRRPVLLPRERDAS